MFSRCRGGIVPSIGIGYTGIGRGGIVRSIGIGYESIIKILSFLAPVRPVFGSDTPVFGPMPPSPIHIQVKGGRVQGVEWAYSMGRGGGGYDPFCKFKLYSTNNTNTPMV